MTNVPDAAAHTPEGLFAALRALADGQRVMLLITPVDADETHVLLQAVPAGENEKPAFAPVSVTDRADALDEAGAGLVRHLQTLAANKQSLDEVRRSADHAYRLAVEAEKARKKARGDQQTAAAGSILLAGEATMTGPTQKKNASRDETPEKDYRKESDLAPAPPPEQPAQPPAVDDTDLFA